MQTLKTIVLAVAIFAAAFFGGCSYRNVDKIKAASTQTWNAAGFEVIGYEGYQIGMPSTPGGRVWYIVQRRGESKTRYHGFLSVWGSEIHIYNLKAIDAISGG